jgi:DNA polymerase-1
MALEEGLSVHIYSGDKDLMQLITNSSTAEGLVKMIDPMTMTHWEHDAVVEKWGVAAHQLGDVLALAGDSADNIPGVPGIGPKIAAQLVQQFGSLEELLANLDQVPQPKRRETLKTYRDQAILSQQLVTLIRDLSWDAMTIDPLTDDQSFFPPPERVGDLRMAPIDPDRILSFYEAMGFVTIKEKMIERLQRQSKIDYSYQSSPPSKTKSKAVFRNKIQVPKPTDFDSVPF